jgi:hypothetical protein
MPAPAGGWLRVRYSATRCDSVSVEFDVECSEWKTSGIEQKRPAPA